MPINIEQLAEMLEVTSNIITNWESTLGLNINIDKSEETKNYSDELVVLFKKVHSLLLKGFTIIEIKNLLSVEIDKQNNLNILKNQKKTVIKEDPKPESTIIIEESPNKSEEKKKNKNTEKNTTFQESLHHIPSGNIPKSEIITLFETILMELKMYTERTIAAEKKVYLLEDYENRSKKEYFELSSEVKQLKSELEEKESKLKEFEEQKKRLNLMEIQLKIMQFEKSKKKFWEFWK